MLWDGEMLWVECSIDVFIRFRIAESVYSNIILLFGNIDIKVAPGDRWNTYTKRDTLYRAFVFVALLGQRVALFLNRPVIHPPKECQ